MSPEQKERRRFYLLPGMGGRAYHRKQRRFRNIAIAVGILVSTLMALVMLGSAGVPERWLRWLRW